MIMKAQLYDLYHRQGKSLGDIGAIYGVSRQAVSKWFKKYGIPKRTKSKARLLALQKGKFENKDYHDFDRRFFDEWSPAMAYLLGLTFADGHVCHFHGKGRADHSLAFGFRASSDLPSIINTLLSSEKPPREIVSNGKLQLRLRFNDEQLTHRLIDLGIPSGKKSHKMDYPAMSPEFDRHFIRGFFDGDGGIYRTGRRKRNGKCSAQIRFYSSSLALLNGIAHCLTLCGFVGYVYEEGKRICKMPQGNDLLIEGAYRLVYSRQGDRSEIFDFLYGNVPDGQFLPSKKRKFQEFV